MRKLILLLFIIWITGKIHAREIVYLIDTGIKQYKNYMCETGHANFSGTDYIHSHGDKMAQLIVSGFTKKDVCLVDVKYYNPKSSGRQNLNNVKAALRHLLDKTPGIINLSMDGTESDKGEAELLFALINKGFKITVAAGNNRLNLSRNCDAYPACYFTYKDPNVRVASNYRKITNKNGPVTHMVDNPKASSEATAIITNLWLEEIIHRIKLGEIYVK
jgi:hypothetical protein